jgi:chromosome partitioning protein
MAKRIVVINQKGGAGKTTTSRMLIEHAVSEGKRVLAIDADPQSNLSEWLGYRDQAWINQSDIETSLIFDIDHQPTGGLATKYGCDLIPSSTKKVLDVIERTISGKEILLRKFLNKIDADYDYVIIDTAPVMVGLTLSTVVACPNLVIPIETADLGISGTANFFTEIIQMIDAHDCKISNVFVLPTQFVKRQSVDNAVLEDIRNNTLPLVNNLFNFTDAKISILEPIPENSSIKDSFGFGVAPQVSLADKRKKSINDTIYDACSYILGGSV